jgi:hypothetical protein
MLQRGLMSRVMRARVTRVVTVIAGMMGLRGRRESRAMDAGIIIIMIMGRGMGKVGKGRGERGAPMHMRKYLNLRVKVQRRRVKIRGGKGESLCLRLYENETGLWTEACIGRRSRSAISQNPSISLPRLFPVPNSTGKTSTIYRINYAPLQWVRLIPAA